MTKRFSFVKDANQSRTFQIIKYKYRICNQYAKSTVENQERNGFIALMEIEYKTVALLKL
jgi:hypothetical protein